MSASKPTPDAVAAQLALFIGLNQVAELRALHVGHRGRTFAGWFDGRHLRDMARHALALSREAAGVYFTPNPVYPELLDRRPNTCGEVHRGKLDLTTDYDVAERRVLLIDIDPRRWHGDSTIHGTTAARLALARTATVNGVARDLAAEPDPLADRPTTARELTTAASVARRFIIPSLAATGFRSPLAMLSGNGIHLVYQWSDPLPTDGYTRTGDSVAKLLESIASRFDCYAFRVDVNTYNPVRLLKVPGTVARKGEASPCRPHRMTRILSVPNDWRHPDAYRVPGRRTHVAPAPATTAAAAPARASGDTGRPRPGVERPAARKPAAAKRSAPERPALFG